MYILIMSYIKIAAAVLIVISVNLAFSVRNMKDIAGIINYSSKYTGREKALEVERYSGYDNVVQFLKDGDSYKGNAVIVNTLNDYSARFTEFFNYAYLSLNKVYYAPFHEAVDERFSSERGITKMVVLTKDGVIVHAGDSLFERRSYPLFTEISDSAVILRWVYPHAREMVLHVSDLEGRVIYERTIASADESDSIHEAVVKFSSAKINKGIYYWTVSLMGYSRFMSVPGRFRND